MKNPVESAHLPLPGARQYDRAVHLRRLPPDTGVTVHPTRGTAHGRKGAIDSRHATAHEQYSLGRFHRQRSL